MMPVGAGCACNTQFKTYLQIDPSQVALVGPLSAHQLPLLDALLSMLAAAKSSPLALALALRCMSQFLSTQ
ncbi:hypothetical protein SDRG_09742 [Saprolegnia diclina VS20]|uniref:Uncharacterized protein n=1 Tax=Saprolegnia diclina (strain VS20) TaxID=1156394 RepID=T0QGL0_SAPDV|nr:hypothetical protein SDRG_09742 [Saprolegnia diclina VS20]EQC32770.1 hypothetical protein SDRG_09742 [Saprolegnia diclina VS20]|eukprot:XP_008613914.1 hypothetical protein SDRG_09742 [Saprolegnia diclina VS20]